MANTPDPHFPQQRYTKLRLVVSLALMTVLVSAAWWYMRQHWDEIATLRPVKPYWIIPLLAGFSVIFVLQAVVMQRMLRVFALHMPLRESMNLSNATTMLNFLLPVQGGMGLRAVYLIKAYNCPIMDFLSMTGALSIMSIFMNTGLGFVAMLWIAATGGPFNPLIAGIMVGLIVATGGAIVLLPKIGRRERAQYSRLRKLIAGWNTVIASRYELAVISCALVGQSCTAALGYYAAFSAFALPFDPPSALVLLAATSTGGLFNFTPGALGFQELVGMYFASILPTSPAETLVVLGAYKLMWVLAAIGFGLPGMLALRWRVRTAS